MQSVVLSVQFIFGDDWNDMPCPSRFLLSGNDVIPLKSRSLILVYLYKCTQSIQKQIVKYDIKSKYSEEYLTVDKVGIKWKLFSKEILLHVDVIPEDFTVTKVSGTVLLPRSQNNRTKK